MKKISRLFFVMIMTIALVVPFANVNAKTTKKTTTTTTTTASTYAVSEDENAVVIHVFYLPTCSHCAELHEFLGELKEDKDYKDKFNIKDYNVQDSANVDLLSRVREYFKSTSDGVPYYVIGDQDFEGFSEKYGADIKKSIDDLYGSKNYKDVVDAVAKDEIDSLSDDANNIIGMVVLGACVVIIIVLIICSSKNKYYEDDEESEEDLKQTIEEDKKEEQEEEKKEEKSNKKEKSSNKNNDNKKKKK